MTPFTPIRIAGRSALVLALPLVVSLGGAPASAEPTAADVPADEDQAVPPAAAEDETSPEFKIIIEAEVPEGFPTPGPAGEVSLKQYPAYRAARADGGGSFRILFNHIQRNDIAMTTPVEMTLDTNDAGKAVPRPTDMAFLYVDPELGDAGGDPADTRVDVIDLPARTYLSYGFFGNSNPVKVAAAIEEINDRLANDDTLTADGPARMMGYNSPFVPAPLRYHEIQQPVAIAVADEPVSEEIE